jgi:hypothetical protein
MLVAGDNDERAGRGHRSNRSLVLTAIFVSLVSLDVILALVASH